MELRCEKVLCFSKSNKLNIMRNIRSFYNDMNVRCILSATADSSRTMEPL
jgi:hypothetical protein